MKLAFTLALLALALVVVVTAQPVRLPTPQPWRPTPGSGEFEQRNTYRGRGHDITYDDRGHLVQYDHYAGVQQGMTSRPVRQIAPQQPRETEAERAARRAQDARDTLLEQRDAQALAYRRELDRKEAQAQRDAWAATERAATQARVTAEREAATAARRAEQTVQRERKEKRRVKRQGGPQQCASNNSRCVTRKFCEKWGGYETPEERGTEANGLVSCTRGKTICCYGARWAQALSSAKVGARTQNGPASAVPLRPNAQAAAAAAKQRRTPPPVPADAIAKAEAKRQATAAAAAAAKQKQRPLSTRPPRAPGFQGLRTCGFPGSPQGKCIASAMCGAVGAAIGKAGCKGRLTCCIVDRAKYNTYLANAR